MIGYKELIGVLPKLPAEAYTGTLFRRVTLAALQSVEPHQFLFALGAVKMAHASLQGVARRPFTSRKMN